MILNKIKDIIIEQLDLSDEDNITMETSMMADLNADSLDAVEIIMALEDEFGISIPDEDTESFENIGDIVKYIENKIA